MSHHLYRIKSRLLSIVRHNDTPFLFGLFLLVALIAIRNFPTLGSWQTGWDNLHPEFNFFLNFKRSFFAMWQEFQGVGLVGGHGYAATLPHTVFLWVLSVFLPPFLLRPLFTFLMLFVGSTGVYFLTKILLHRHEHTAICLAAFLAGVTTIVHLITMQNFFIQLEAFIVHFAFLPWMLWSVIHLWKKPDRRSWLIFIILNIVSATTGFIPPLFVVESGAIGLLMLFLLLSEPKQIIQGLHRSLLIVLTMFCLNAYWLIPVAFYTKGYSQNYINAYNNINSTDNFIIQNEKYGTFPNVALGKSFLFDANDAQENGTVAPLLTPWNTHIQQPWVVAIGYTVFIIACIGCVLSLTKETSAEQKALAVMFLLFVTFLATKTAPFSWVSALLQEVSPIFRQAFRVAYTKFSIAYGMTLAVMVGLAIIHFFQVLKNKQIRYFFAGGWVIVLCLYSSPIFQGYFTYPRTRIAIPNDYFQLFTYLKTQPNGRIMNLPQGWNWGWTVTTWGYTGSGFLWYGIEQPIMDRAFDVWSPKNENYYWELNYALYSKNRFLLEQLIKKYDIQWILYDESIVPYLQPKYVFQEANIRALVNSIPDITLERTFGTLSLYRVSKTTDNFISLEKNLPSIGPATEWMAIDQAYIDNSTYIVDEETASHWYPFRNLFSNRETIPDGDLIQKITGGYILRGEKPHGSYREKATEAKDVYVPVVLSLQKQNDGVLIQIKSIKDAGFVSSPLIIYGAWNIKLPKTAQMMKVALNDTVFDVADLSSEQKFITLGLQGRENTVVVSDQSGNVLGNETVTFSQNYESSSNIFIPRIHHQFAYDSEKDPSFFNHNTHTCARLTKEMQPVQELIGGKAIEFSSSATDQCFDIILPNMPQSLGYLVEIESQHEQGRALSFTVINKTTQKADMEIQLPIKKEKQRSYVIIPPTQTDGLGYSIKFINKKGEKETTKNYLYGVRVTPFPFNTLSSLSISEGNEERLQSFSVPVTATHANSTYYSVKIDGLSMPDGKSTLILHQSFDAGWKAYEVDSLLGRTLPFIFGKEIKNHVLVNNWANGWKLPSDMPETTIVLFFVPQLLEWGGFILLLVPFCMIPFLKQKNK